MFGVGLPELIVIAVTALLIFGPDKLPELTQKFGRFAGQTRKMSDSVRREFCNAVYTPAEQFRRDLEKGTRELLTVKPHLMAPTSQEPTASNQKVEAAAVETKPEVARESGSTLKAMSPTTATTAPSATPEITTSEAKTSDGDAGK